MYTAKIVRTAWEQRQFLKLPGMLYTKNEITQDVKTEKQLLEGNHCLSNRVNITPILVLNEGGTAVARCILTFYNEDDNAYVGFYECISDLDAAKSMLLFVKKIALENQKKKLIGPLDVSFWIGYRFKADHFEHYYTGEPYNKDYYIKQWEACGFTVSDKYYSNQYKVVEKGYYSPKYQLRLKKQQEKGIKVLMPDMESFEKSLKDVYGLLIELYADFPGFKYISKNEFIELFASLKYVLDFKMVRLVYDKEMLVGFFISIPNYGNLTCNINLLRLLKIMQIKKKPKEYIMLYLGVAKEHLGLGAALAEIVKTELSQCGATSVGALIHEGKVSGIYYKDLIIDKYHYVLMECYC